MAVYFIYYNAVLLCCWNCFSFRLGVLSVRSCVPLTYSHYGVLLLFFSSVFCLDTLSYSLPLQDAPRSSWYFPPQSWNHHPCHREPVFFYWKVVLESKIWALGVLTCFLSPPPAPSPFSFFPFKIYLFIHWLWWLPIAVCGLSLVWGSRAPFPCSGFSCWGAQALGTWASVVAAPLLSSVAHGLSCSLAWGIFPDQGWSPCPLHCKLDSWRSPSFFLLTKK